MTLAIGPSDFLFSSLDARKYLNARILSNTQRPFTIVTLVKGSPETQCLVL